MALGGLNIPGGGGPYSNPDFNPVTIKKFEPPKKVKEIIGIIGTPMLVHLTDGAQLTQTIFDYTTRADSARILLTNGTGAQRIIRGAAIRAKLVTKLSDTEGFIHDKFVDYESIEKNGEIEFELGNDFIVTVAQVNWLADYHWKNNRAKRHMHTLNFHGFRSYFEPGEWYTLTIGGAGQAEYIAVTAECYAVRCSHTAGGMPYTSVTFREMVEDWKFDSNEVARSIASGQWGREQSGRVVTVAASTHIGDADYYCDGTADQVEILAAIAYLVSTGGGTVRLVGGTFNTTAAVVLDDHIMLEIAAGATIKKNFNGPAVSCSGTSGTHKHDVGITGEGMITRDAADTNGGGSLVTFEYVDNLRLSDFAVVNPYFYGVYIDTCTGWCVHLDVNSSSENVDGTRTGIVILSSPYFRCENNQVSDFIGNDLLAGDLVMGIGFAAGSGGVISNNVVKNIGGPTRKGIGIYVNGGTGTIVRSNSVDGCTKYGIDIESVAVFAEVGNNHCSENGNLIEHGDCEATGAGNDPHITGDGSSLSNATFARSNLQKYAGTYSYLFTKTNAAGTAAYAWLVDNNTTTDMHGLSKIQGAYKLKARVFVPSGGIAFGEVNLIVSQYYGGAWNDTLVPCADLYDAWQAVEATMTMNAACTGVRVGFMATSTAAVNEIFYVDNVQFIPRGVTNEHQQNFYDAGTDTATGGNSWQ